MNSSNASLQTFNSLLDDYKKNQSNNSDNNNVMTTLSNMWTIVSNAGKLKNDVSLSYENLDITFTTPTETSESRFIFHNLQIQFEDYGKYQIVFIVDGIESPLSGFVEITQVQSKVKQDNVKIFIYKF